MTMARLLRGLVLALVGAAFATAAGAVDMTGTWEGRESCHCFNEVDGRFTEKYRDQVMEITQDGTDLNIEAYGELFNGNVIDHPRSSSKGEASLIACDTDPTDNASFGETGRAKVSAKANGRGRMTIESLWNAQEGQICTCKSRLHRADASDPEVDDCSGDNAVDKWHKAMLEVVGSDGGCSEVEYPSMDWVGVPCGEASSKRSRSFSRTVGGGNDWVVRASQGQHLSTVTGSFENVSNVTSITDSASNEIDNYSLQLNSNFFTGSATCEAGPNPSGCLAWQQAVYTSAGTSAGSLIFQYWLISYNTDNQTCPAGWWNDGNDCYVNATGSHYNLPPVTIVDFPSMQLSMVADLGEDGDAVIFRIDRKLYKSTVTAPDSTVGLAGGWTEAEFNVFGAGGGSQANFNTDASLDVKFVVNGHSGGALSCNTNNGTTGETNNLNLVGECNPVSKSSPPAFTFNENNR